MRHPRTWTPISSLKNPNELAHRMPWTVIAFISYLSTLALGIFSLRRRGVRREWHAGLFIVTTALTIVATAVSFFVHWSLGVVLVLALVLLALLPFFGRPVLPRPGRHIAIGLSAAPCYLAAIAIAVIRS